MITCFFRFLPHSNTGDDHEDSFPEIQPMDDEDEDEEEEEEDDEDNGNEFITINVTNEQGVNKELEHIKEKK